MTMTPWIMAEDEEGGDDTTVITDVRPKTKRPPLYKVLLLNDDYTPMEFVVHVLERFFGMTALATSAKFTRSDTWGA